MSISKYFDSASPREKGGSVTKAKSLPDERPVDIDLGAREQSPKEDDRSIDDLREEWRVLYAETLPRAAREKASSQAKWLVTLDHCFGRIVLDNAVGRTRPWTEAITSPAIKNMTSDQFRAAIALGNKILDGSANLVELDENSLALRGKRSKIAVTSPARKGNKRAHSEEGSHAANQKPSKSPKRGKVEKEDQDELYEIIDSSDKTDFQKKCLKLLVQIPAGQFSTYGAMSKFLESSPRAVGNAMRGNPFAPRVPCHRILAADRSIGGFGGSWGAEGEHVNEKLDLLRNEGVRFDSKGKVLGPIFTGFTEV